MQKFLVTTNTGLEKITAEEIYNNFSIRSVVQHGAVEFKASLDMIPSLNLLLRTIHKVVLIVDEGEFKTLDDLYKFARRISYVNYINKDQSFAVRAERVGFHSFTSIQVAEQVGRAIIESFLSETNHRLKVNLDEPDVEFFCKVKDDKVWIGINTTGESLHKRGYRVYDHPAALKTTLATSMIFISKWKNNEAFIDPTCGGGTIPIEAALIARNIPPGFFRERKRGFLFKKLKFIDISKYEKITEELKERINFNKYDINGIEISPKHLSGALKNAESAGVIDTVNFKLGDSRNLKKFLSFSPEVVVFNPPYGKRSSSTRYIKRFYPEILNSISEVIKRDGVVVTITSEDQIMEEAALKSGFSIEEKYETKHGNLPVTIFKFRK